MRGMFCLCTVLSLLCSRGAYVFHTCSLCLIVFFSLCELVFHCIHLCIHRSHSLVLILLWAVCAWLKLLSLGVCFSAHNVNLLYGHVKHCFSILNYCVCFLHGNNAMWAHVGDSLVVLGDGDGGGNGYKLPKYQFIFIFYLSLE